MDSLPHDPTTAPSQNPGVATQPPRLTPMTLANTLVHDASYY